MDSAANKKSINSESKTLWIGDLQPWMDEATLTSIIEGLGYKLQSIKLIKDKLNNGPPKYGFIEFQTKEIAVSFFQSYNSMPIPNHIHKKFKLNWSTYGTTKTSQINSLKPAVEIQVYVGDLPINMTEHRLLQLFRPKYQSVFMAKIITDPNTKVSRGYGFVKFANLEEANKAITEMNGLQLGNKTLKVSHAHQKGKQQTQQNQEQAQTEAARLIKIYENFYSMMNDPTLKAQYEKQALRTFQNPDEKSGSLKQKLEGIPSLNYKQTLESEQFINHLPKMLAYKSKLSIAKKMY